MQDHAARAVMSTCCMRLHKHTHHHTPSLSLSLSPCSTSHKHESHTISLSLSLSPSSHLLSSFHPLPGLADCMEHQQLITQAGAIPAVVQLLKTAPAAVQDTAAGILGNLAIQNPANQSAIVAAGALPPLVGLLLKGTSPAKEQACFAMWNLACQHPENQLAIEQAAAIKPLVTLLSKGSASLQEEAAGALMNLAAHPDNKRGDRDRRRHRAIGRDAQGRRRARRAGCGRADEPRVEQLGQSESHPEGECSACSSRSSRTRAGRVAPRA